MFQDPALLPSISVYENIEIPLKKIIKTNTTKNVDEIIDVVGLKKFRFLPKRFIWWHENKSVFSQEFYNQSEILLLDEPFSSLDTAWKNELYLELSKLKRT
ncbi:MAG: hypothetical protein R3B55_00560 [Candidatus Paceibacterota bacterium]